MAKRLDTPLILSSGRRRLYPWSEWIDGSAWRLERGTDFDCEPTSMASQIRDYASRHGLLAVARVDGDVVDFMFADLSEKAAA
jgi:hypothetical protein